MTLLALSARAQLPRSGTIPAAEWPLLRGEVQRVEKELSASPGNCWVMNEMARTWAAAQQHPETMEWLDRIAGLGFGLDPSRDPLYKELRGTREFEAVLTKIRAATPPISNSKEAFRIAESDLAPESSAYDPVGHRFYFGSMRKGVIVGCDASGKCGPFASGLGTVVGVKIAERRLWAVANHGDESALVEFNLASGRPEGRFALGKGHRLNDIAIGQDGDVFATDTQGGSVWRLRGGEGRLEPLAPQGRFRSANGIGIAPNGKLLYVSSYPDGITVVDLKTGAVQPISRPAGVCLALIDGLYVHGGSIIAIQNGSMAWRVARFYLGADLRGIERMQVLERRNPLFEGITGGTIAGEEFYYPANIQDEKRAGSVFDPIRVLKLRL